MRRLEVGIRGGLCATWLLFALGLQLSELRAAGGDAPAAASRIEASKRGRILSATPAEAPESLFLRWRFGPGEMVEVQRADGGSTNWSSLAKVPGDRDYRDAQLQPGRPYQYRLLTNDRPARLDASAGLRLPPVEDRGTVMLMVDETLASGLRDELADLERDLVADGWRVVRQAVPRHDDREWRRNTNAITGIRARVQQEWHAQSNALRSLFLIGHVAIPYSGMRAEDLHTGRGDNHFGAWPSDQYYADVDGVWTDREPYPDYLAPVRFAATQNVPGDGKFDTEFVGVSPTGNSQVEMAFGRVDFAGMPAFGRGSRGELALLRRYFGKAHRHREGAMPVARRAVVGTYLDSWTDTEMFASAYRTGSRLFGVGADTLIEGDLFALPEGQTAAFGFQSGGGAIDRIRVGRPDVVTTRSLTDRSRQPRVLFAMLLGSWFGDWAVGEDNLLRGIIASEDYGLAAFWVRFTEWRFDPLARGGTLGDAQLLTANESLLYNDWNRGTTRTLTILGDPTLRLHATAPPRSLRGTRAGNGVRLTWQSPPRTEGRACFVYRSSAGWRGPYVRLTPQPIEEGSFLDGDAPRDAVYLVRATELIATGSGSYTNLSQGVFWPAAN